MSITRILMILIMKKDLKKIINLLLEIKEMVITLKKLSKGSI